jgi:acyl transferase domain-containing protein
MSSETSLHPHADSEIAVIGLNGRFPKAPDLEQFWKNLCDGVESLSRFTDEELIAAGIDPVIFNEPKYIKAGYVLENADLFDASFFGFSAREAEMMDPQQRLFLECAWEALESAGYDADRYPGAIGVYAGTSINRYMFVNLYPNPHLIASVGFFQTMLGNDKDFLPTRVSYKLNLRGPSVAVQTACSTSLSAIHLACQSLLAGECDIALAGGVSVSAPQKSGYLYQEGGIFSPDGHCRAFDAQAQGTVGGNGVGIVILKRLADALAERDTVHAIIKGSAINNDGALKLGYTAPSIDGQEAVIAEAHAIAGVAADTITYVEAHGTGTPVGDPIEIAALVQAFQASTSAKQFCAVGSLKTNIGHLDAAAGVAGFIKTVLSLKNRMLPPSLHYREPNPGIDFDNSPFYINASLARWETNGSPRRAGVSSFGIGGTNVHLILEEAPAQAETGPTRPSHLLVLSAKTELALQKARANLAAHLKDRPDLNLADVAYTLKVGRRPFEHRLSLVGRDIDEVQRALATPDTGNVTTAVHNAKSRQIAFMFPGQGSQYVEMARELYELEPVFAEQVNGCAELLREPLKLDLRDLLFPQAGQRGTAAGQLLQTAFAQPALFVIEYALARLWMEWGVRPQAMIGHSIGEYVAACLSGVFSLEDALSLVSMRGRLMQEMASGEMLAVALPEQEVQALLAKNISLAAVNGSSLCVVSGPAAEIERFSATLAERKVNCQRLRTSHAFHSHMMDPMMASFTEEVSKVTLNSPRIRYISNVTGTWVTAAEATDPAYWARHLRQTVRFAAGLDELFKEPERLLLEVGPGRTLTSLARQHPSKQATHLAATSLRPQDQQQSDLAFLLESAGRLWLAGVNLDWPKMHADERPRRIPLPTYPFERQRYWVDAKARPVISEKQQASSRKNPNVNQWLYAPTWKRLSLPVRSQQTNGIEAQRSNCLVFSDECGLGSQIVKRLESAGHSVTTVMGGPGFARAGERAYRINLQQRADYESLLNELREAAWIPDKVLHLWNVTRDEDGQITDDESFATAQWKGFYSLIYLSQAWAKLHLENALKLCIISTNLHEVVGGESLRPEKATLLGPCKVIPQEYPNTTCYSVDVLLPRPGTEQESVLINQIITQLHASSPDTVIAYRGNHRWVPSYEPVQTADESRSMTRLKERGVYLLTGGLGAVGFVLAGHLARAVHARLILNGRTALPPREEWPRWLETHEAADAVSRKIRKVQELEALGAEVLVACADVAEPEQMRAVVARGHALFGPLNGVIHAAGVVGKDSFQVIQETDATHCERQFKAKAHGLFALEKALEGETLDFCMLTSSLSAVLGGMGFAAYSAANLFMDAFAHQHNQKNGGHWLSVNWDAWQLEEKRNNTFRSSLVEFSLNQVEGVEVFQNLMRADDVEQVLVSTGDLQARVEQWIKVGGGRGSAPAARVEPPALHERPALKNEYVAPRDQVEETIANICQDLLGIDRVGVFDDFLELGSHSLQAAQLASKLSAALKMEVSVKSILLNPSIAALAEALRETGDGNQPSQEPRLTGLESPAPDIPTGQEEELSGQLSAKSPEEFFPEEAETFVTIERRPLLSLFAAGKIAPVDAAALSYLPTSLLQFTDFSPEQIVHYWCGDLPIVGSVLETHMGRLASIILPLFDANIYAQKEDLLRVTLEALEIAGRMGARQVSLTGMIPSATNYGYDLATAMDGLGGNHLPHITTGHATTCASVVLTINKILRESERRLAQEDVGFVGLGSIGGASLRLMLRCLPHPRSITLCDVFDKRHHLEEIQRELIRDYHYRGVVNIAQSRGIVVAEEIYRASLLVGATNVPNILDIALLRPGTLIVDDSSPHCFDHRAAAQRLLERHDILFTEGGMLRSPGPIKRLMYLPPPIMNQAQIEAAVKRKPRNIFGCMFSGLLTASDERLKPTLGLIDVENCFLHYQALERLDFEAADLHCEDFELPPDEIRNFRSRFNRAWNVSR